MYYSFHLIVSNSRHKKDYIEDRIYWCVKEEKKHDDIMMKIKSIEECDERSRSDDNDDMKTIRQLDIRCIGSSVQETTGIIDDRIVTNRNEAIDSWDPNPKNRSKLSKIVLFVYFREYL